MSKNKNTSLFAAFVLAVLLCVTSLFTANADPGRRDKTPTATYETFTYDAYYDPFGTVVNVDRPDTNLVSVTVKLKVDWNYGLTVNNESATGNVDYSITFYSGAVAVLPSETNVFNTQTAYSVTLLPRQRTEATITANDTDSITYTNPIDLAAWINNPVIATRYTSTISDSCSGSCSTSVRINSVSHFNIVVTYEYLDCGCDDPDGDGDCDDLEHKHRKHHRKDKQKKR
jgi:hypothetical protein